MEKEFNSVHVYLRNIFIYYCWMVFRLSISRRTNLTCSLSTDNIYDRSDVTSYNNQKQQILLSPAFCRSLMVVFRFRYNCTPCFRLLSWFQIYLSMWRSVLYFHQVPGQGPLPRWGSFRFPRNSRSPLSFTQPSSFPSERLQGLSVFRRMFGDGLTGWN